MHNPKRIIPVVLIIMLGISVTWFLTRQGSAAANGALQASGTVEAVEISVAPELSGRVAEVMVAKGDHVEAGDALLRLDDELLQSQRKRALAAQETAQTALVAAQVGVEMAQATLDGAETALDVAKANAEAERLAVQQALDDLYEAADLARAQAEGKVAVANRAVRETQYLLDNYTVPTEQQSMTAMEAVVLMKERLDQARAAFEPYKYYSSSDPTRQDLKEALDEAQSDYDSAVRRLEYETQVSQAQAALDKAQQDLAKLANGPDPDAVAVLQARLSAIQAAPEQAQAAVEQAKVGLTQSQVRLDQAVKSLDQAQVELDVIDVQLKKLVVYASTAGVVLGRNVEVGEVIQMGAPVMTIGRLDQLTITVYVPEDRYGQIELGESAQVRVDSFPGQVFDASVVYIAGQAEFTPRNVQTAEGRRTTVFAVELQISGGSDGSLALKPGMPADVQFGK
ncbi:MAG: HlyD family efflux transporter periplasmic adaptor subunit [Chloroflexota bacterium]